MCVIELCYNSSSTVCVSITDPRMTLKHRDFGPLGSWSLQCHIIRINVKSKDFGTALAMWESWHRCAHRPTCINKSIKPTTPTSHSPKQVFLLPQSSLSPTQCFFIAWVNLAPEQSRWSRFGHQVRNGGASMPNASQVNLAHVLAYIAHFCTPSVSKFLS